MSGIREALSSALEAEELKGSEIQPVETPVETAPVEESASVVADDRPRGPDGKFLPKAALPSDATPLAATPAAKRSAPQAWKKDFHPHWEKLEPTLQDYIEQREKEAAEGIGKHRGAYDKIKPFADAVQPYLPILQQHGLDPVQHVGQLLRAHQTLALAGHQEKLQMFQQLAQQYGVPLQTLTGQVEQGAVDPKIGWLEAELRKTQSMVQGWQQQTETQQNAAIETEIDRFSKDPQYPHFESLKPAMAQLLNAGVAEDLPSAYSKALRLNDDLWTQEQTRQREAQEAEKRQKADAAAKLAKAAATPRSTPSADMARTGGKKDLRSTIAEAVDQHIGRV